MIAHALNNLGYYVLEHGATFRRDMAPESLAMMSYGLMAIERYYQHPSRLHFASVLQLPLADAERTHIIAALNDALHHANLIRAECEEHGVISVRDGTTVSEVRRAISGSAPLTPEGTDVSTRVPSSELLHIRGYPSGCSGTWL